MSDEVKTAEPSYFRLLQSGEFRRRVQALEALLERCTVCPRDCLNNRLDDEIAACYSGRLPVVSAYTAHFGEEPALVGTHGARATSFLGTATAVFVSTAGAGCGCCIPPTAESHSVNC